MDKEFEDECNGAWLLEEWVDTFDTVGYQLGLTRDFLSEGFAFGLHFIRNDKFSDF